MQIILPRIREFIEKNKCKYKNKKGEHQNKKVKHSNKKGLTIYILMRSNGIRRFN